MGNEARSRHKKYQPHRTDILWNTDWGIALQELSKDQAEQRGLLKYKGRWVTPDERRVLKDQFAAYRSIRVVACLTIFGGTVTLIFASLALAARPGGGPLIALLVWAGLVTGTGKGLWSFQRWARNLAVLLIGINIVFSIFLATHSIAGNAVSAVVGVLCIYYLVRETAGRVFAKIVSV